MAREHAHKPFPDMASDKGWMLPAVSQGNSGNGKWKWPALLAVSQGNSGSGRCNVGLRSENDHASRPAFHTEILGFQGETEADTCKLEGAASLTQRVPA